MCGCCSRSIDRTKSSAGVGRKWRKVHKIQLLRIHKREKRSILLVVLLDPFTPGRNAVLDYKDHVVRRWSDVIVGNCGDFHAPVCSDLHRLGRFQIQWPLALRERVRREGRAVLIKCHTADAGGHVECHSEDLVVFQIGRGSSDRRSDRIKAEKFIQPQKISVACSVTRGCL